MCNAFQNANILVLISGSHCEYPSPYERAVYCSLGALLPRCLTLCVLRIWFLASVVRAFERNDFFDAGITKAQLFLSLHDAVLFALSRKFPESYELSTDESETVIQETYSETNKVGWYEALGLGEEWWWGWGWGRGEVGESPDQI